MQKNASGRGVELKLGQATIRDVAREANVSVASVSRALNGLDNVRPQLKQRIEEAVTRLNYIPHAGARSLALARTHAIGVILPDLHGEFFSELLRGMDREATARGWHLLLSNMHADPQEAITVLGSMRGRVDGLVIMAPEVSADQLLATVPPGTPAMLINAYTASREHAQIRTDNVAAARQLAEHMIGCGCRRLVHLSGPPGNLEARERIEGYRAAMAVAGLPETVIEGQFSEQSGTEGVRHLLAEGIPFDGIFAANDMMAIGALVALREAGRDVPGEVALAGFDDIPLARLVSPPLTTMRVDMAAAGARAIERIVAMIGGEADQEVELRTLDLVIRESTAKGVAERLRTS